MSLSPRRTVVWLLFCSCVSLASCSTDTDRQSQREWPFFGGDAAGSKYSPVDQINAGNVDQLELAWTWKTGEAPIPVPTPSDPDAVVSPNFFKTTPLMIGDTLYLSTPFRRVVALDANTGTEFWSYDPRAHERPRLHTHRGVATWTDGSERRIILHTNTRLIVLDARTGQPIPSFGEGGEIDVTEHLRWDVEPSEYQNGAPPVIYGDLIIVGSSISDSRLLGTRTPPGDVQAFDVRTGERVWSFSPVPQAGDPRTESWEDDSWSYTGHTNVWAPMTVDEVRGLLYLPVGTPTNNFYGGRRRGDNLFAESLVCLDAATGELVWYFQTVHHGIWDYDLPAAPNLVTIQVDGKTIDAVAAVAKTGFLYVFDRVTGEPVWPIEERPVPQSDVPHESTSPTQPFPTKPPAFARQGTSLDDVIDFTPELRAMALEELRDLGEPRLGPIFTPPSVEGTVMLPGPGGGGNWGGAALDPGSAVVYVVAANSPAAVRLRPVADDAEAEGLPPLMRGLGGELTFADGIPVFKPPYATLTAIDLNVGELIWQVPFGDSPDLRDHPLLQDLNLPRLGLRSPGHGLSGPVLTGGGLLFISGSGPVIYAIDQASGETLWEGSLGGRLGYGTPMTYEASSGRQFVVIAAGEESDAALLAFALPLE